MKHSAQAFAFLFITFPLFVSCIFSSKPIVGNHQLVNKQIAIEDYDNIILSVPAEVLYKQYSDSAPYLQIHTDENIFNALDVRVENHQLIIEAKKDSILKPSMFTIYTTSHNLNLVNVVGSGEVHLKGEVNSKDIQLQIIGSGIILSDSLICDNTAVNITGEGNLQLTGASNHSSFMIVGAGNIRAYDYLTQELKCTITGSGNIEAFVTNQLDVNIMGAGNIFYKGNPPTINNHITGAGKVAPSN